MAVAVADDLDLRAGRERVDDRHADPVEAAGDGVGLLVELAAGVQRRQRELDGRELLGGVEVDGDPSPVVGDLDATVPEQRGR